MRQLSGWTISRLVTGIVPVGIVQQVSQFNGELSFITDFCLWSDSFVKEKLRKIKHQKEDFFGVRETLWNFIGHSVLLGESFHKTELISV